MDAVSAFLVGFTRSFGPIGAVFGVIGLLLFIAAYQMRSTARGLYADIAERQADEDDGRREAMIDRRDLREQLARRRFHVWSQRSGLLYNRTLGQMLAGDTAVNDPAVFLPDGHRCRPGEFMRFDTDEDSYRLCLVDGQTRQGWT